MIADELLDALQDRLRADLVRVAVAALCWLAVFGLLMSLIARAGRENYAQGWQDGVSDRDVLTRERAPHSRVAPSGAET